MMKKWFGIRGTLVTMACLLPFAGHAEEHEYVGAESCKICHNRAADGAQFNQWEQTKHAQAYEVLKTAAAKEVAARAGITEEPHEAASCLQCHVTSYNAETRAVARNIKLPLGVQCETCHGPGSGHLAEARRLQLSRDPAATLTPLAVQPTKELCVQCHNETSPTWDPERYTLEDGTTTGFSFELARPKIDHPNPQKQDDDSESNE